ncbi:extracellular metallo proteinase 1 [Durotheca rogersii]|uniref:extracellular metallo proteinase 1 n=1 Tax=Durotheca rogersii TaxID=419775 RepID=UPI00221F890F|nr:extracellular metallo proteinase 1 [Durotheca rogersii]KAI5864481.1 extracellular metallo proteinase 1 [Durotheca rogersii]
MRSIPLFHFLWVPHAVIGSFLDSHPYRLKEATEYSNAGNVAANHALKLLKRGDYVETATELVRSTAPDATFRLVEDHYVGTNGIGHVHFRQTIHGLDVDNADFNVNVARDGSIFSFGNSFFAGDIPQQSLVEKRCVLDAVGALDVASSTLQLPISGETSVEGSTGIESYTITGTTGTVQDPEASLVYFVRPNGDLALTWKVETRTADDWVVSYVDVEGESGVLGLANYISYATYDVYPWGLNDPSEGARKITSDPWDVTASKHTWHDSRNTTAGNNADVGSVPIVAQVYAPTSENLTFEYPYVPDTETGLTYRDAAVAQVFYTVNMHHDLLYILGFTPAAGNFQADNYGEGGRGYDAVRVRIHHWGGKNNGYLTRTVEGVAPELVLYLFNFTDPERDAAFDNGFVIHEYTHGLSGRLTGGPRTRNCLDAFEADGMAEGWSDFYAAAVMLKPDDTRENATYGFAAWPTNSTNPPTARKVMYTTDMEANPWTYSMVNSLERVHEVGTVWASLLYEVLWNLIDKHGKNDAERPEMVDGVPTDGKFLAMKIVLDAMALQPCNPTFVQARDAIVDADVALTGGQNVCEIWRGFAKRGLGRDAIFNATERVDSFDLPDSVC